MIEVSNGVTFVHLLHSRNIIKQTSADKGSCLLHFLQFIITCLKSLKGKVRKYKIFKLCFLYSTLCYKQGMDAAEKTDSIQVF